MSTSQDEQPIVYGAINPNNGSSSTEVWTEIVPKQDETLEPTEMTADLSTQEPLFPLGQIVMTPGAEDALNATQQTPMDFIHRHVRGDWGELEEEDKRANDQAVQSGTRLLSAYFTSEQSKIWVITEWDRSVTTLLLPSEY